MSLVSTLESMVLSAVEVDCDPLETLNRDMVIDLDIDQCEATVLPDGRVAVVVMFAFTLFFEGGSVVVCDIEAAYRLVFSVRGRPTPKQLRILAVQRAVPTAWPAWRQWLAGTLGQMGLQPAELPAVAPDALLDEARDAFEVTSWEQVMRVRALQEQRA